MNVVFVNHSAETQGHTFHPPPPARPVQRRLPRGLGAKGKRIHVCGFVTNGIQCGKVTTRPISADTPLLTRTYLKAYTRAEHLRRHQLSHTPGQASHRSPAADPSSPETRSGDQSKQVPTSDLAAARLPSLVMSTFSQPIGQRNYDELELMHHHVTFMDSVYLVEGLLKGEKPAWNDHRTWWLRKVLKPTEVTDDAKDMVLSISSAHMTTLRESERFDPRSLTHYTNAVASHRQRVQNLTSGLETPTSSALESMFFQSFSLSVRSKIAMLELGNPVQNLNNVLAWFSMCRGYSRLLAWALTSSALESFMSTSFYFEVACQYECSEVSMQFFVKYTHRQPKFSLFGPLFTALKRDVKDSPKLDECWNVVKWIEWIYLHFLADRTETELFEVYMQAAYTIPQSFSDLLFQRHPAAVAILLHYLCIEKHTLFEDTWWTYKGIEQKVESIATLVPPSWSWAVEWPLAVVRGEVQIREYPLWAKRKGLTTSKVFDEKDISSAAEALL